MDSAFPYFVFPQIKHKTSQETHYKSWSGTNVIHKIISYIYICIQSASQIEYVSLNSNFYTIPMKHWRIFYQADSLQTGIKYGNEYFVHNIDIQVCFTS